MVYQNVLSLFAKNGRENEKQKGAEYFNSQRT